jgi:hypothetical protein
MGRMRRPGISRHRAALVTKIICVSLFIGIVAVLALAFPVPPTSPLVSDNFANALDLTSLPPDYSVDISAATTEFTDPDPGCGTNSRLRTVWYKYMNPAMTPATIVVDTANSNYDTILSVYAGNPGAAVDCNDDATGLVTTSKLTRSVAGGATVYFMVSQADSNGAPQLKLTATVYGVPSNDTVGSYKDITGQSYTDTTIADYEATAAMPEPTTTCDTTPQKTVWYRYSPIATGTVTANTTGSKYDTVLNVYSGTNGPTTYLTCNDDANGAVTSQVSFNVTTNTKYWLMVSAYDGDVGTLTFHFDAPKRRSGQITSQ